MQSEGVRGLFLFAVEWVHRKRKNTPGSLEVDAGALRVHLATLLRSECPLCCCPALASFSLTLR